MLAELVVAADPPAFDEDLRGFIVAVLFLVGFVRLFGLKMLVLDLVAVPFE